MKALKSLLQYGVPLLLAGALLFYTYKDFNFAQLQQDMQRINLGWVALSFLPMILSHYVRAVRWAMLLKPLGFTASKTSLFVGVMGGYFANLILPRMGEVVRCGLLHRREGVPASTGIGTVLAERGVDVIVLLLITALAFALQFSVLYEFFLGLISTKEVDGTSSADNTIIIWVVVGIIVAIATLAWRFREKIMQLKIAAGIFKFAQNLMGGVASIFKLEKPGSFILQSFGIWGLYFLSTFFGMLSMPETMVLGLLPAFIVLVTGSYGMVAPVQGGIGAYHAMVIATLTTLYMLDFQAASTMALILHTAQTLLVLVVGGVCYAWAVISKPKRYIQKTEANEASEI